MSPAPDLMRAFGMTWPLARPAAGPRRRGFELRGQTEQRRLVAEAAGELDADRQPVAGRRERHGHRRVAGGVEERREPDAREDGVEIRGVVRGAHVHDAEALRWLAHRRAE